MPELGLGGNKEEKKQFLNLLFKIKWLRGWRGSLVAKSACSPRAVSAIPLVYVKLFTNACHSSSRRPDAFLQPPRHRRTGIKKEPKKGRNQHGKIRINLVSYLRCTPGDVFNGRVWHRIDLSSYTQSKWWDPASEMGESQEMQDGRVKLLLDRRAAPQIVTTALFVSELLKKLVYTMFLLRENL